MKKGLRNRFKAGFTIVEVTIAASVMALVLGSSLSVIGRGLMVLDTSRAVSYTSQIMQSEFEKMRLTTWGDGTGGAGSGTTGVSAYPTTWTNVTLDSTFYSSGDMGSRMTMQRIAANAPGHTAGMIQVTLKISWTTMDGRALTKSYITYYGKNGLYDLFTY